MNRAEFLQEVANIVTKDRNAQYGEPEDTFALIAQYWSLYLSTDITSFDVAMLMALMKMARIQSSKVMPEDSLIDLAGYAACAIECGK